MPSANFVIVQTSYLEQLATAQKAALDAVKTTSENAINAARDKEEWLVRIVQTVGVVFAALAVLLGYFGMSKYTEVRLQLMEINSAAERAKDSASKVEKTATELSNDFTERIDQLEKLFVGIQTQKMVMEGLKHSSEKKKDATAALPETLALYELAVKHQNDRVKSYVAACLTILYNHAENWIEAVKFGQISVDCNPKAWSDRIFNLACIYARKFNHAGEPADRQHVKRLLKDYFERNGTDKVNIAELDEALADEDLKVNATILADIKAMKQNYEAGRGNGGA